MPFYSSFKPNYSRLWRSHVASALALVAINGYAALRYLPVIDMDHLLHGGCLHLWFAVNLALGSGYGMAYWRFSQLLKYIRSLMSAAGAPAAGPAHRQEGSLHEIVQFVLTSHEHHQHRRALQAELDETRAVLEQCTAQQQIIMQSTHREAVMQYQHVLGYAHYLEEQIARHRLDDLLRLDFDDVSESSFALKLMAGAIDIWRTETAPTLSPTPLAPLLQRTLLSLSPSLDRRSMRFDSSAVDEQAIVQSHAHTLTYIVWMVWFGLIRYAAPESTFAVSITPDSAGTHYLFSVMVTELAPGQLSPRERHDHLIRQMQRGSQHMFAETIRIHAHIQVAEMLLARLHATIAVEPVSAYACAVTVRLPRA